MSYRRKHIHPKIQNLRPKQWFFQKPLFWVGFLSLALISGFFYLWLFFPKFQVRAVEIFGNAEISTQDLETATWANVKKNILGIEDKNIFTVDAGRLQASLLAVFPLAESIAVKKQWFDTIRLEVAERQPVAAFCPGTGNQQCFFIDKGGVIFESAPVFAADVLIVRQSGQEIALAPGQTAVEKNTMESIIKVRASLKQNFQIGVKDVLVANPMIITTQKGWQIYLDPAQDIGMQITKMELLLKNEITPAAQSNLRYLYLQYKDRAYYK